jgi:hypothetical protein
MSEQIQISEGLREKVLKRNLKLSAQERLEVEALYLIIAKRKLGKGCTDCLNTAYKVIENYMTYYAPRKNTAPPKQTKVTSVSTEANEELDDLLGEAPAPSTGLLGFKLRELREMYPEIAEANPNVKTIKGFVELIERHEQQ